MKLVIEMNKDTKKGQVEYMIESLKKNFPEIVDKIEIAMTYEDIKKFYFSSGFHDVDKFYKIIE